MWLGELLTSGLDGYWSAGVVCGVSANRIYHLLSISKAESCAKHCALHQIKKWPTGGLSALFVPMGHDANCFLTLLRVPSNYARQLEWRGVCGRSESLSHWSLLCALLLSLLHTGHWVRYRQWSRSPSLFFGVLFLTKFCIMLLLQCGPIRNSPAKRSFR